MHSTKVMLIVKKILDFGCGNGCFVEEMRMRNLSTYGCDITPKNRGELFLIRQGLNSDESSKYIRYHEDLEQIPFENSFLILFFLIKFLNIFY